LDAFLYEQIFYGKVLDIGGKKNNKRGMFNPPLKNVESWEYLNIDQKTNPDYCCSAYNLPIQDHSIDMALMIEVLEHLDNPTRALEEAYRVLKHRGSIILTVPFLFPIHADPDDFQRWTLNKIENELKNIGFVKINIKPMGSIYAVIYDLIHVSLNGSTKNQYSIKNKVINRLVMPIMAALCKYLDLKYMCKSNIITTGYQVIAEK